MAAVPFLENYGVTGGEAVGLLSTIGGGIVAGVTWLVRLGARVKALEEYRDRNAADHSRIEQKIDQLITLHLKNN